MDVVQRLVAPLVLSLLAACSLYSGDDDGEIGPDDGTSIDAAIDGASGVTYRAEWECFSKVCQSPLMASDRATLYTDSATVRVSWYRAGDPAPMGEHAGAAADSCIDVPRDVEARRSAYRLCPPPGAPAPVLDAAIAWGDSQWYVLLTPL
jgi:hypothetical protein